MRLSTEQEHLTEPPFDKSEADQAGGEQVEAPEDVEPALVADGEASEAAEPGEGALDHPPVSAEPLAAVDAAPSDPGLDPAPAQDAAAVLEVIAFVGMQLDRSLPRPAVALADRRHRLDQPFEELAVVPVRRREKECQRDPVAVDEEVTFGACSATIRRVRANRFAPLLAGNDALSAQARLQSIAFACPADRAGHGAAVSKHLPLASPVTCASRSCRSRSPSPAASAPSQCRCAAPTRSRPSRHGPACEVGRLWAWQAQVAQRVPSPATAHRKPGVQPCPANNGRTIRFRFDRHS